MLLQKTDKARTELSPGMRTLGLRERSMLLLADGNKSLLDFRPMFGGEGEQIALDLIQQGYLQPVKSGRPASSFHVSVGPDTVPAPLTELPVPRAARTPLPTATPAPAPAPAALAARPPEPAAPAAAPATSADSFEGKRSLATTRMFLFDICERMFARRDPKLAEQFREALRGAKDRASMLAAGRDMIAEIERVAGHERADSISERIAMLMPPEPAIG